MIENVYRRRVAEAAETVAKSLEQLLKERPTEPPTDRETVTFEALQALTVAITRAINPDDGQAKTALENLHKVMRTDELTWLHGDMQYTLNITEERITFSQAVWTADRLEGDGTSGNPITVS